MWRFRKAICGVERTWQMNLKAMSGYSHRFKIIFASNIEMVASVDCAAQNMKSEKVLINWRLLLSKRVNQLAFSDGIAVDGRALALAYETPVSVAVVEVITESRVLQSRIHYFGDIFLSRMFRSWLSTIHFTDFLLRTIHITHSQWPACPLPACCLLVCATIMFFLSFARLLLFMTFISYNFLVRFFFLLLPE